MTNNPLSEEWERFLKEDFMAALYALERRLIARHLAAGLSEATARLVASVLMVEFLTEFDRVAALGQFDGFDTARLIALVEGFDVEIRDKGEGNDPAL